MTRNSRLTGLTATAPFLMIQVAAAGAPGDGVANVRDFGAVGDGKADDTDAIQKAVDARRGGVWLPKGRYRITRTITIELDKLGPTSMLGDGTATIVMAGAGPAIHLIGTHEGTADPKTVTPNVWQNQRMPIVRGIEIVGEHSQAVGIEATHTMQAIFTNVGVRWALHGIHLTTRNRNVIIADCHLYQNRGAGLFLDGVDLHQINVTNCHISYNGGGGVVLKLSSVRNLHIGTCDIEANMDPNGPPTANVLIDTSKGEEKRNYDVREGAIVGCTIQHTHDAPGSANIRFIGREDNQPNTVGRWTIADNVLSDVNVNIHLIRARGVTITGNTLWKGFEHNLLVEGSAHILVGSNLFERNPCYRPLGARNAVVFRDCRDCTITGCHIHNVQQTEAGLTLERCKWMNVTDCLLVDCDGAEVFMKDVEHMRLAGCLVRDSREAAKDPVAIKLTSGKGNLITGNIIAGKTEIAPGTANVRDNEIVE